MPFGPDGVTLRRSGQQFGMEVGYALEERRPVLLDLLVTGEASAWMSGLLAPVLAIETGEKCLQIVLVHRIVEALDSLPRRRLHSWAHSSPLLSLRSVRSAGKHAVSPPDSSGC